MKSKLSFSLFNDANPVIGRPLPSDFCLKREEEGLNPCNSKNENTRSLDHKRKTRFDKFFEDNQESLPDPALRLLQEMRSMYIKVNVLNSASGSAYLRLGDTKIIAAVYGPRHLGSVSSCHSTTQSSSSLSSPFSFSSSSRNVVSNDRGQINLDIKATSFAFNFYAKQSSKNKEIQDIGYIMDALQSIVKLERYSMSFIDIHVTIIESHGELFSSILNCIGLALADASIEMHDCLAAITVYSVPCKKANNEKKHLIALDMSAEELEEYSSNPDFSLIHLACCAARDSVFFCRGERNFISSANHFDNMLALGEAACQTIGKEIQSCLRYSYARKLKEAEEKNISIYGEVCNTKSEEKSSTDDEKSELE